MNDLKILELKRNYDFYNFLANNGRSTVLDDFQKVLHHENRFFINNHKIFEHIKSLFDEYTIVLSMNELLFRARKVESNDVTKFCTDEYNEEEFYGYNKKDSFVPLMKNINANRANAKGIPCLYAAKEEKTAIAEIRPFLGSTVSVATIKLVRDLKIFDLYFDYDMSNSDIVKLPLADIWFGLAFAYSIPYENSSQNEYLLTQCVSEYFQISGFDGIQYSSSLNEGGKNLALFNCKHENDFGKYETCEPISSHCCIIKNIKHEYEFYS